MPADQTVPGYGKHQPKTTDVDCGHDVCYAPCTGPVDIEVCAHDDQDWPCETAKAHAAGVAAGRAGDGGSYEWAVRLKSSTGGEWVLPRDDEAHARQFVAENPPGATVVRRWISDWESP